MRHLSVSSSGDAVGLARAHFSVQAEDLRYLVECWLDALGYRDPEQLRVEALIQRLELEVEELLTLLELTLFQNARLIDALDERDAVIEQLRAATANLNVEVNLRARTEPSRVRWGTKTLSGLLMTATAAFAGAAPVAVIDAVENAQPAGNTITVQQRIENIYHLCDTAEAPPANKPSDT
jgi:hypothetical protein